MATYNLFKTLVAPTGVENAVYCNFISDKDHNLITACANNLTIYRLNPDLLKLNDNRKLKFECIQSFQLFGTISAISSCRYGSMRKDALVLAFLDAKLSIVEFNEQTGELDTVSIHYFENEIESVCKLDTFISSISNSILFFYRKASNITSIILCYVSIQT